MERVIIFVIAGVRSSKGWSSWLNPNARLLVTRSLSGLEFVLPLLTSGTTTGISSLTRDNAERLPSILFYSYP